MGVVDNPYMKIKLQVSAVDVLEGCHLQFDDEIFPQVYTDMESDPLTEY